MSHDFGSSEEATKMEIQAALSKVDAMIARMAGQPREISERFLEEGKTTYTALQIAFPKLQENWDHQIWCYCLAKMLAESAVMRSFSQMDFIEESLGESGMYAISDQAQPISEIKDNSNRDKTIDEGMDAFLTQYCGEWRKP